MDQTEARKMWEALKEEMKGKIDQIDQETPWSAVEPHWWLEMMEVRRSLEKGSP